MKKYLFSILLAISVCNLFAQPPGTVFTGPIKITKGGTYTGNFQSTDPNVYTITVETSEPVIIENCILTGVGADLIHIPGYSTVTVRYNKAYGLVPTGGKIRSRFINAYNSRQIVIENNYLEKTAGILIDRWDDFGNNFLRIRFNEIKNIDKRRADNTYSNDDHRAAIQLNTVRNMRSSEIAWNQITNEPTESLIEDCINIYNSGGRQESPMLIHDNFIFGAYPYPATNAAFTGSGITVDGSRTDGNTKLTTSAFIIATGNQVVNTCNAAMNIAIGHDVLFTNNRLIGSGLLPNGTRSDAFWSGVCIWNGSNLPDTVFYNNKIEGNIIGYMSWDENYPFKDRQDENNTPTNIMPKGKNTLISKQIITREDELAELDIWKKKLADSGIAVGLNKPVVVTPPSPGGGTSVSANVKLGKKLIGKLIFVDSVGVEAIPNTVDVLTYDTKVFTVSFLENDKSQIVVTPVNSGTAQGEVRVAVGTDKFVSKKFEVTVLKREVADIKITFKEVE